ncbi:hypothetical protein BO71DRAFT_284160, partial [Aspergillus ellipticus CBS 707.79]
LLLLSTMSSATITIRDPSDSANLTADASDNALTADWNYTPTTYQTDAITGPYTYTNTTDTIAHATLTASTTDTSVLVIPSSSNLTISDTTILKHGYSSDLYQSSFFGLNAAINIANASTAHLTHTNITSHNGAANLYAYGNTTLAIISSSTLYSSGAVIFSSGTRGSGSEINFTNTRLTVLPETGAALWFGNVVASSHLVATTINTTSGILVIANHSQVTQGFSYFADSAGRAEATITVTESALVGDLVAYNGSVIRWAWGERSEWTGKAYSGEGEGEGMAYFAVELDGSSRWRLTGDAMLKNFTDGDGTLGNLDSGGFTLYYDAVSAANGWLNGTTRRMKGGGYVRPATEGQL